MKNNKNNISSLHAYYFFKLPLKDKIIEWYITMNDNQDNVIMACKIKEVKYTLNIIM